MNERVVVDGVGSWALNECAMVEVVVVEGRCRSFVQQLARAHSTQPTHARALRSASYRSRRVESHTRDHGIRLALLPSQDHHTMVPLGTYDGPSSGSVYVCVSRTWLESRCTTLPTSRDGAYRRSLAHSDRNHL